MAWMQIWAESGPVAAALLPLLKAIHRSLNPSSSYASGRLSKVEAGKMEVSAFFEIAISRDLEKRRT